MQKLSGIISGQNNKGCSIIHHESNKSSFAFFWFFYDFLRNLQESAKSQSLFKNHFARRSLETSDSYEYTLAFAVRPLELKGASQCDPWRSAGAAPAEIRRLAALGCGGKGGETQGSPRGWFACSEGVGRRPAVRTPAPGSGRRWISCSGEPPAEGERRATRLARRWPRGGASARG
jgi:hypothetical protein